MANPEHLKILKLGVKVWNKWRQENHEIKPDLSNADLQGSRLRGADLNKVNLSGADLSWADLREAEFYISDLKGTLFNGAKLWNADLGGANLSKADLSKADIRWANISEADLSSANLREAIIEGSNLSETNFENADLTGCHIYAISAWNLKINERTKQSNLIITRPDEPTVMVDDLEVAQFIYLLLNNQKIRNVIDTITSKVVLILGRFSEERKPVLDQLRDVLRDRGLAPVLFDFDKPASKDITGTVETLARMARFIIADLTDPSSIPHELATIVPFMRTTPVVPIRLKGSGGYSMFDDLEAAYKWVLPKYEYDNDQNLIESVSEKIIDPAVAKVKELQGS